MPKKGVGTNLKTPKISLFLFQLQFLRLRLRAYRVENSRDTLKLFGGVFSFPPLPPIRYRPCLYFPDPMPRGRWLPLFAAPGNRGLCLSEAVTQQWILFPQKFMCVFFLLLIQ